MTLTKHQIIEALHNLIAKKIATAEKAIALAIESRDSDGKSSAGDKYETNRSMMQIEIGNQQKKLFDYQKQKSELSRISVTSTHEKVQFGSLVLTDKGLYFLSIGLGLVKIKGVELFVISVQSPIGRLLSGQKTGASITFNGISQTIESIQ